MVITALKIVADQLFELVRATRSDLSTWEVSDIGRARIESLLNLYETLTVDDLQAADLYGVDVSSVVEKRVDDLRNLKEAQEAYLKSVRDCDWLDDAMRGENDTTKTAIEGRRQEALFPN